MACRRIGWCFGLCALALLPALVARAAAEPVRLAALTAPGDGAADGAPLETALDCLALNVYWEARAEPRLGQIAVAEVTLNRVADPAFPDTVCGVVRQGEERGHNLCQFSWYCDGEDDRPRNPSAWQQARRLALLALSGRLPDPTAGALWFHSDQVHPDWPELAPIVKIGSHIFYRTAPDERPATARLQDFPPLPPARKPAPPVRLPVAEVIPAMAPSVVGPHPDPMPATGHAGGCDQDLMRALAVASEADFLALVGRMRRERADRGAPCAGGPGDERTVVLAPASAALRAVQKDPPGSFRAMLQSRMSSQLAEPAGLPRPPNLDRMPASPF